MSATCGQRIGTAQVDVRHGAALTIDPAVEALLSGAAPKPTNDVANLLDVALVEPEDVSAAVTFPRLRPGAPHHRRRAARRRRHARPLTPPIRGTRRSRCTSPQRDP